MAPKLYFKAMLALAFCTATNAGVYFKEIAGAGNKHGQAVSLFHKKFHRCGMKDNCNFVIRNLQSDRYSTASMEQHLPANTEGFNIWKKEQVPVKGRGRGFSLTWLEVCFVTNYI